jgi:hypothetical protein
MNIGTIRRERTGECSAIPMPDIAAEQSERPADAELQLPGIRLACQLAEVRRVQQPADQRVISAIEEIENLGAQL